MGKAVSSPSHFRSSCCVFKDQSSSAITATAADKEFFSERNALDRELTCLFCVRREERCARYKMEIKIARDCVADWTVVRVVLLARSIRLCQTVRRVELLDEASQSVRKLCCHRDDERSVIRIRSLLAKDRNKRHDCPTLPAISLATDKMKRRRKSNVLLNHGRSLVPCYEFCVIDPRLHRSSTRDLVAFIQEDIKKLVDLCSCLTIISMITPISEES